MLRLFDARDRWLPSHRHGWASRKMRSPSVGSYTKNQQLDARHSSSEARRDVAVVDVWVRGVTATRGPMAADGLLSCRHEAVSTVENVRPRLVAGVLPVLVIWAVRWCPTPLRTCAGGPGSGHARGRRRKPGSFTANQSSTCTMFEADGWVFGMQRSLLLCCQVRRRS